MAQPEFDVCRPWGAPGRFLSRDIGAAVATERWQVDAYYRLRRDIFEREQHLFAGSDIDDHDAHATPIVAMSRVAGMPHEVVGVVRIFPSEGDTWYGGRLGVAHDYRRVGAVGGALIYTAVSTAHAYGCTRFLATVQERNVRYFEHYDFRSLSEITLLGRPHHLMEADLSAFPPCPTAAAALEARHRARAA
jgi:putative N-acetyltransferase (TIGR04045 family)